MKINHNNKKIVKVFFTILCSFALLNAGIMIDKAEAQPSPPERPGYEKPERPGYEKPELKKIKSQIKSKPTEKEETTITIEIGPKLKDCVGLIPQQCMQVKEDSSSEWELFYDHIKGFEFESGFHYVLEVKTTLVIDPPADASSIEYKLVKILEKNPSISKKYPSPKKQMESGVLPDEIQCKEHLTPAIRTNGNPVCITESTAERLNWTILKKSTA